MLGSSMGYRSSLNIDRKRLVEPYCQCWEKRADPVPWKQLSACSCGEKHKIFEWKWERLDSGGTSWVALSEDRRQVTFHPFYSSGTAGVRGDKPFKLNKHYYWEVKMLSKTYGTDIMVGVGTNRVNIVDSQFRFTSLLGQDAESYGLSYKGTIRHNAIVTTSDLDGFCLGSIIGVRLDMWSGTLEFYINRKSQGISFYNLRKHQELFPILCSTAAQSSMRLTYASSWRASLLVDAAKMLAASVKEDQRPRLPPGLWHKLKSQFWMTLPTEGCILDEHEDENTDEEKLDSSTTRNILSDLMPNEYTNGFYVDNVERNYRIVVKE